jgi:DinB family protein
VDTLMTSRQQILKTIAGGDTVLAHATATRMVGAHTLTPAPRDPVRHLEDAYARARRHLARLTVHDPSRDVPAFMTEELFSRLTDAHPAPLTAPAGVGRYTYTPRKTLRRVLDHALDHLNQIDQWLAWQHRGAVPTPTDGWVPSTVTLPDDRLPLTPPDLDAWLWRVDQAARLVQQRAAARSEAELDWRPPDGGWPLRRVLHHVARWQWLYAGSLDDALEGDAPSRYEQACRRFDEAMKASERRGADPAIVYAGLYGVLHHPKEVVELVLTFEGELLAAKR